MRKAVIAATGPSLVPEDLVAVQENGAILFVVNDAYRWAGFAAVLYACDAEWWDHHLAIEPRLTRWFNCYTINEDAAKRHGLNRVKWHNGNQSGIHFDTSGEAITSGHNSGFQALNLAYMMGYREAILLGFDMGHDSDEPSHFFGDHPGSMNKQSPYDSMIRAFEKAAPIIAKAGMKVVNASRKTRLTCFPRVELSEAL